RRRAAGAVRLRELRSDAMLARRLRQEHHVKRDPSVRELDAAAIRAKEQEFLWPSLAHYYQQPVVPVEASQRRVRDIDGKEYLDFFGGILTISVGHAHPKVNG